MPIDQVQARLRTLQSHLVSGGQGSRSQLSAFDYYKTTNTIVLRWADNDQYGHVNNAHYYQFFDTTVNSLLIKNDLLNPSLRENQDLKDSNNAKSLIGFAISSGCTYLKPVEYPGNLIVGLRVAHLGNSSVKYELAIFKEGEKEAAAYGWFTHVYVDKDTQRPSRIPDKMRSFLESLA